jgi:xanthine dehydrogenase accessory factor
MLLNYLDPANLSHLRLYETLAATVSGHKRAWLVTRLPVRGKEQEKIEQVFVKSDGSMDGNNGFEHENIKDIIRHRGGGRTSYIDSEGRRFVVEDLCGQGTVLIFGGGHVGLALSRVSGFVGFKTVVLDDRYEFANADRFPDAEEVVLLECFPDCFQGLEIDEDSYIVIVTRGHLHDKTVLRLALKTRAGYIGMIGSRKKRDAIYEDLIQEGFKREDMDRVHSPIGLAIGAETPEEIAVCILGELIKVRVEKNR